MRIRWDETKRELVLKKRDIDLARLSDLLGLPYIEDQRIDDPEQFRIIGFIDGRLKTFIIEYREDDMGEYIWVVTAWTSTKQEAHAYDQKTH
jgi:uncharacterized DUF497 family protein